MSGTRSVGRANEQVDICVGGLWHACDLGSGLAELGFDVRIISTSPIPRGPYEAVRIPVSTAQRLARRVGLRDIGIHRAIGRLLVSRLRRDSQVIAWSSFALPIFERGRSAVVVRGSHHIQRQREILADAAELAGCPTQLPSERLVALEREEYRRAVAVSVPTDEIAMDPYWAEDQARAEANPYGFPSIAEPNRDGGATRSIVFAGEVGFRKGIDRIVAAFPSPNAAVQQVHVLGRIPAGARWLQLPSWWTLHGRVSHTAALREIGAASALVLLSREEGMARVGMEAMASGTPIIVSPMTGLGRWIADGGGRLVDPDDPVDVRGALDDILSDWWRHSARARDVAASWTWVQHAEKMTACLAG